MECIKGANVAACPCPKDECPRKGACCECLRHNLAKRQLPTCCFATGGETATDRSFDFFARQVMPAGFNRQLQRHPPGLHNLGDSATPPLLLI